MTAANKIPKGWALAELAAIVEPRRMRVIPSQSPGSRYIGLEHVEAHTMRLLGSLPASELKSMAAKFERGDVLYGRLRPYLNKVVRPAFSGLCSTEFIIFPDNPLIRSDFLQYWLNSFEFMFFASHLDEGDRPRVDFDGIGKFRICLPPEPEQRRIVAKIEELFSDLDAGVAALERVKANLKRYRAAVLKAAVEGKLTAEWRKKNPPTETGEQLLQRILAERQKKWEEDQLEKFTQKGKAPPKDWKQKYQPPKPPDVTDLPALPDGWCRAALGELAEINPAKDRLDLEADTAMDFFPMRDVEEEFGGVVAGRTRSLSEVERGYTQFRAGDLIFAKITPCMENGKLAIIPPLRNGCGYGSTEFHVIRPSTHSMGRWFARILSQESMRKDARTHFKGTAGQLRVPESWLTSLVVPLPPINELDGLLDEIERRLSVADAVAVEVERSLKRAASLRQAILKRAFEGKLVAQDPADEPASALLERIKAQRAGVIKQPSRAVSKPLPRITAVSKKISPAGLNFKRAAIAAYAVNKLHQNRTFGRVQLEKILYLGQAHIGLDLGLQFERYAAGPLDISLYKLESLAKKKDWFTTSTAPTEYGVRYHPGGNINDRLLWAEKILGQRLHEFDALLEHIFKMNTDQAELFATIHAVWSELLAAGKTCGVDEIVKGVHAWHKSKRRFTSAQIEKRMQWMRKEGYVPKGAGNKNAAKILRGLRNW